MILYEAAFLILPFPIEYLASVVSQRKKVEVKFPPSDRSKEFKEFLLCILVVDPQSRAGGMNWQKKVNNQLSQIFTNKWVLQSMK
jgi:serine/threonine protein kinase